MADSEWLKMMEIIEYFSSAHREAYLKQIESYEWSAAKFLATLLRNNRFKTVLGGWGRLYLLVDGNRLVSFLTLSGRDCISEDQCPYTPWLGFFHTAPEYRGNHYGQVLIDYLCLMARNDGYHSIYVATDHIGLYEKYGFEYIKNCKDIRGEDSRIYKRKL